MLNLRFLEGLRLRTTRRTAPALGLCFALLACKLHAHGLPSYQVLNEASYQVATFQGLSLSVWSYSQMLEAESPGSSEQEEAELQLLGKEFAAAWPSELSSLAGQTWNPQGNWIQAKALVQSFVPGEGQAPKSPQFGHLAGSIQVRIDFWDKDQMLASLLLSAPFHRWSDLNGVGEKSRAVDNLLGEIADYLGRQKKPL